MALVLGVSQDFPHRDELVMLTFGVVLFSLLIQGLSIKRLLRRLGIAESESGIMLHQRLTSEIIAADAAIEELEKMKRNRLLSTVAHDQLAIEYRQRLSQLEEKIEELRLNDGVIQQYQEREARIMVLRAEKSALLEAERSGLLDEDGLMELFVIIDRELEGIHNSSIKNQ